MPERVHTRFEDDEESRPEPQKTSTYDTKPVNGRKRKRNEKENAPSKPTKQPTPSTDSVKPKKHDSRPENHINGTKPLTKEPIKPPNRSHINKNGRIQRPQTDSQLRPPAHLTKRAESLLPFRKSLPIWSHQESIRASLRFNNILILTGETGSGKSTQVPQFLLAEPWCTGQIAITQPRRVAAISLARRVAEEMGSPAPESKSKMGKVGYSVRFDSCVGPGTRLKYLTEGMLLQEMLGDPGLKGYSCVVVDEVHERSVNVDLILGFLKKGAREGWKGRGGKPLKVVVMSATADVEGLVTFFDEGAAEKNSMNGDGKAESEASRDGIHPSREEGSKTVGKAQTNGSTNGSHKSTSKNVSVCFVEGRQFPVKITYLPEPTQDFVEAALKAIFQIHYKEPLPGDVLVFLTGQDTVEALERLVNEYAQGMDASVPKILALPLFAALPQTAQQKIFAPAPPKTRKIILSTNIAETSVTVPGVRYVIDSGKSKLKQFRPSLSLDSLLVKPISQSSAIQRAGRAGREAPGQCWRLYTEGDYRKLEKRTLPEILRCDLGSAVLGMKARGVDDIIGFPFLETPPREAMEKALLGLLQLGALTETGHISEIGRKIAKFPLSPTLGRVLVEAAREERDCLVDVIDVISCLSVENIFLNLVTEEKKEEAEEARRELYRREGDHLTLLRTAQLYAQENADRKAWCERRFVGHRAMVNVMDIRKQLRQQCLQLKLLSPTSLSSDLNLSTSTYAEDHTNNILHCLLRGFASNTARLMPDGSYRTLVGNQTVAIHPSSVLFGKKVEAIVFSEFVFTNKSFARGVSAVRLDWVGKVLAGDMA